MNREEFEVLQPGDKIVTLFDDQVGNYGRVMCVTDRVWVKWEGYDDICAYFPEQSLWYRDIYKLTNDAVLGGQQSQPEPTDAVLGGSS